MVTNKIDIVCFLSSVRYSCYCLIYKVQFVDLKSKSDVIEPDTILYCNYVNNVKYKINDK